MPLGISEISPIAGMIERGGEFLSKEIQDTGKTIEAALIRNRSFKQAAEFGAKLSQINPQSDEWPQAAAALASQYPLAIASGLGPKIMEPMAKAYAGYQAAKRVDTQFGNQVAMENLRNRHIRERGPTPFLDGAGTPGGLDAGDTQPIVDVRPGRNTSMLGAFGPAGLAAGIASDQGGAQTDTSPLPPLPENEAPPDAATSIRQRYSQIRAQVADDLIRDEQERAKRGLAPRTAKEGNAAIERQAKAIFDAEVRAGKPAPDLVPSSADPNVLINSKTGSMVKKTTEGISRIGSELDATKFAYHKEQDAVKQQAAAQKIQAKAAVDAAESAVKDLQAEMSRAQSELAKVSKFEFSEKPEERAQWEQRQRAAQQVKDKLTIAQKAHQEVLRTASRTDKVKVKKPDGTVGFIPAGQLEEAKAAGYTEVP